MRSLKDYFLYYLFITYVISECLIAGHFSPIKQENDASTQLKFYPNEYMTGHLRALMDHYNLIEGGYLGVGTERAFIATSLCSKCTFAVFLDNDDNTVRYNRINLSLIKLSVSREDLINLRKFSNYDFINGIQNQRGKPGLISESDWKFWLESRHYFNKIKEDEFFGVPQLELKYLDYAEDNNRAPIFEKLEAPKEKAPIAEDIKANLSQRNNILTKEAFPATSIYLQNDNLYLKLKKMADSESIDVLKMDVLNLDPIIEIAKSNKLKFSVLDFSNIPDKEFLGFEQVKNIIKKFGNANVIDEKDTVVIFTYWLRLGKRGRSTYLEYGISPVFHFLSPNFKQEFDEKFGVRDL